MGLSELLLELLVGPLIGLSDVLLVLLIGKFMKLTEHLLGVISKIKYVFINGF